MAVSTIPSNPSQDDGGRILTATMATTCIALIVVLVRIYVRHFIIHNLGSDDAAMWLAMMLVSTVLSRLTSILPRLTQTVNIRRMPHCPSSAQWRWPSYRRRGASPVLAWSALQLCLATHLSLGHPDRQARSWAGTSSHRHNALLQDHHPHHHGIYAILHIWLLSHHHASMQAHQCSVGFRRSPAMLVRQHLTRAILHQCNTQHPDRPDLCDSPTHTHAPAHSTQQTHTRLSDRRIQPRPLRMRRGSHQNPLPRQLRPTRRFPLGQAQHHHLDRDGMQYRHHRRIAALSASIAETSPRQRVWLGRSAKACYDD